MAPRAKAGGEGVSALRGKGYDKEAVKSFVERIENLQSEIDQVMKSAKDECQPHREDIDAVKKEAHEAGIPRLELNAQLRRRRLLAKAEAVRSGLNAEQQDNFDQLALALGDFGKTDLGKAAARREATESATTH